MLIYILTSKLLEFLLLEIKKWTYDGELVTKDSGI